MTPQIDIWQWIAYALPGLGILLAWAVRSRRPMFIVLVSSLLVSQLLGMHTLLGLGTLLLLLLCALVIAREHQLPLAAELPWPKQVCYPKAWYIASVIVFLVLLVALSAHLAPGIKNILYLWQYRLGPDVVPMDYYLNFDKPYVALMLAMLFVTPADSGAWRLVGKSLGFYAALMLPPIFVLAMVTGLVNFDPKIPDTFGVWAYSNLLYTCVAEEILFRGLLLA
ncbi:MAG: hypothetical protein OEY67_09470, partial [Gammaproteobacteria bacterium]|nr:hypothetical protein [Gammaproteobacteria bacterium]